VIEEGTRHWTTRDDKDQTVDDVGGRGVQLQVEMHRRKRLLLLSTNPSQADTHAQAGGKHLTSGTSDLRVATAPDV